MFTIVTQNSSIDFKTPYELLLNQPPRTKHIRRFGNAASILNEVQKETFTPKGKLDFLVGYLETVYSIYEPKTKILLHSKHVTSIESKVYSDYLGQDTHLSINCELLFDDEEEKQKL